MFEFQPNSTEDARELALIEIKNKIQEGKIFELSERSIKFYDKYVPSVPYLEGIKLLENKLKITEPRRIQRVFLKSRKFI